MTFKTGNKALAEIVAGVAAIFFLFGLGDRSKLTDELTTEINERVQVQYEYLRDFATAILAGTLSIAMINARSKLYVHDAESNHGYGQDAAHDVEKFPFYSNVLGSTRPCKQCHERRQKVSSPVAHCLLLGSENATPDVIATLPITVVRMTHNGKA
jgi:hypothetical protein